MIGSSSSNQSTISLNGKPIELINYSQSLIELKYYPNGISIPSLSTSLYFDKKSLFVQLQGNTSPNPIPDAFVFSNLLSASCQFNYYDVILPVTTGGPVELLNIINGWLGYVSGITVNGGSTSELLNKINLIEGTNIAITSVPDAINNELGITISASGGITAINSLTGSVQTMVSGTSGTDFAVSSVGTTHTLNLPTASAVNRGALSSADWTIFNGKQATGNYITNLTGDVTASGPGSVAGTIANDAVTFAKMQNITTARLLGRGTASTGDVEEIATALGTTGTDLTWAFTAGTLTLNVPSASASARGVVTTGTQTMAGAKTWSGAAVFSSTVNITATTTANPFVITSTNATGTTFAASITANSGSRGMFVSTNGQAQYAARSSSHTDRELRFQMFSDGHCYFGLQGITGSITSDLVIRTSADSGSNAGAIRFGLMGVNKMAITSAGIAIGSQAGALTATARLHLMAGAAAVGASPLKFTSGINLTTPEVGAVEYDGTYLYFTNGVGTREQIYMGDYGSSPSSSAGTPITAIGSDDFSFYLSNPNAWATIILAGNPYVIPLYEP